MTVSRRAIATFAAGVALLPAWGQGREGGVTDSVIRYADEARCTDTVTRVARSGERLRWEPVRGRLDAVLARLDVPTWSQVLVFSKTSSQRDHVGPASPRAIYFNDSVAVAWIPGAPEIEILSVDARQGARFHAVDQDPEADGVPARRSACLRCHDGQKTRRVPGLLLQSVATAPDGTVRSEHFDFVNGHAAPMPTRWGGWYVTGRGGGDRHRGNRPGRAPDEEGTILNDLSDRLEGSRYLERGSDMVALMVLQHQVGVLNQTIRAGWDARVDAALLARGEIDRTERKRRLERSATELADQLTLENQAPLQSPVVGSGRFAADYVRAGRTDQRGRGFRELDLRRGLYRWGFSPLVHAPAMRALPEDLLDALGHRIRRNLARRSPNQARAVREILSDTEPALARRWFGASAQPGVQRRTPL
ncbi:MAG: hypothetical protein ACKO5K_14225 [Armatimonadota bacterium]